MELKLREKIANDMLARHGLIEKGWRFAFNGRFRTTFGRCKHAEKLIEVAKTHALAFSEEEFIETVLHEIAHALVGPGKGHSDCWKMKAAQIGCDNIKATAKVYTKDELAKADHLKTLGVKWLCVDDKGEVHHYWYRRPSQKMFDTIGSRWIQGKKEETIGKLRIIPFEG